MWGWCWLQAVGAAGGGRGASPYYRLVTALERREEAEAREEERREWLRRERGVARYIRQRTS